MDRDKRWERNKLAWDAIVLGRGPVSELTPSKAIRAAYPAAHIVLLRGGMFGGAQSEPLRQAWESAVTRLEANDPAISHFVFVHWTRNHPRAADDRAMSDELIGWLKQQPFMQSFR